MEEITRQLEKLETKMASSTNVTDLPEELKIENYNAMVDRIIHPDKAAKIKERYKKLMDEVITRKANGDAIEALKTMFNNLKQFD